MANEIERISREKRLSVLESNMNIQEEIEYEMNEAMEEEYQRRLPMELVEMKRRKIKQTKRNIEIMEYNLGLELEEKYEVLAREEMKRRRRQLQEELTRIRVRRCR